MKQQTKLIQITAGPNPYALIAGGSKGIGFSIKRCIKKQNQYPSFEYYKGRNEWNLLFSYNKGWW